MTLLKTALKINRLIIFFTPISSTEHGKKARQLSLMTHLIMKCGTMDQALDLF